jgi:hypothetical protein
MPYADTDFFLALAKTDDWLADRAVEILDEYAGDLWTGLPTFIEIGYNAQEYDIDLEATAVTVLEIADFDGDPDMVFQAYAYIDEGLNVMDAFQAALASGDAILGSDRAYDEIGVDRISLEPRG